MKWGHPYAGIRSGTVAVIQLAIALGSAIGGLLSDANGYQSTFVTSATALPLAALLTFLAARSTPAAKALHQQGERHAIAHT